MSDVKQLTQTALFYRVLEGLIKEEIDAAKAAAMQAMDGVGAERVRVTDQSGTNLGAATVSGGRVTARVVDDAALLAWVRRNHPTEVVETVRPAFVKALLDGAAAKAEPGDDTPIGPDGEVLPGVELRQGDPYLTIRPTAEAKQRAREMLAASGLLAITDGGTETGDVEA